MDLLLVLLIFLSPIVIASVLGKFLLKTSWGKSFLVFVIAIVLAGLAFSLLQGAFFTITEDFSRSNPYLGIVYVLIFHSILFVLFSFLAAVFTLEKKNLLFFKVLLTCLPACLVYCFSFYFFAILALSQFG
jgi:hypothetical protein